jgi:predicted 2-oxoglutarate/Fe(II)-dependent dioxygenase YbiX
MILKEKILFNQTECKSIIKYATSDYINWKISDREYSSKSIHYSVQTKWLFDKLKTFFELETGLEIIKIKEEIHFHKFVNGNWFDKHNDVRDSRIYAVGVLLNDEFEGGEFKLYNPNEITLNKKIGNSYIFDVRILHEITPIIKNTRYSLLWFLQKEHVQIEINKLI